MMFGYWTEAEQPILPVQRTLQSCFARHALIGKIKPGHPPRVAGTAVILTRDTGQVPTALLHALKHYKVLHERVVLLNVLTRDVPHVGDGERLELCDLGNRIYTLRLWYGFMDAPNILRALAQCRIQRFRFNLLETSFIIGREKLVAAGRAPRACA